MATDRLAHHAAGAGDDVENAVRDARLGAQLGDPEQAQRGVGGGLDHDRVAGRERRAQLPGGHLSRVVPRDHGADHAHRLPGDRRERALGRRRDLPVELVRGFRVPSDAGSRLGHIEAHRVGDRLAGVDGLDQPQLPAVGLDEVRPADQDPLAVAGAHPGPAPVVRRAPRHRHGCIHVRRATLGDVGDGHARGGVDAREPRAVGRVTERAVDEQLGPQAQGIDLCPGFVDLWDQGVGHGSLRMASEQEGRSSGVMFAALRPRVQPVATGARAG